MFKSLMKAAIPFAIIGLAATVSGCDGMNISINGEEGVPLAELDMTGDAPTELVVAGPDTVVITDGDTLDIKVEGDQEAVDAIRFALSDGTLTVMREGDSWSDSGLATVRVTMPTPSEIVAAGSGNIEAQSLGGEADVTLAGSGRLDVAQIDAESLDLTVLGSGRMVGAGTVGTLDLTNAGSGSVDLSAVQVGDADISIAGSGNVSFASDGEVDASVAGSGNVTVIGSASCSISTAGSGTVTCKPRSGDSGETAGEATDENSTDDQES